jgi:ATP synthase protein I
MAATAVGFFLGWLLDKYLTSAPWGMVIFALLGIIAGIRNLLRSLGQFSSRLDTEG